MVRLVHRPGSSPPPVRPCDRSNGSDTKTHWTSEELHRALGCRRFRNYWHIIQTSLDGKWVDGGKFLLSLGSYVTIPKAPRGGSINREDTFFLDVVHVDIAFGDCVSVGGFRYALVFVDRAARYNWVFGLKDLSKDSILLAFVFSGRTLALMLAVSAVTVTPNSLARRLKSIWSTMAPILLLPQRVASHPSASSNPIGRSWSTWLGLT